MRCLSLFPAFAIAVAQVSAQTAPPVKKAAETISASDITRHLGVIAADSMLGRDTPSPGLEKTAQYVADQFKRFGLEPGGDNGTWFQRYMISRRQLDTEHSRVVFAAKGRKMTATFTTSAALTDGVAPEQPVTGSVLLVAGPHTRASAGKLKTRDKIVLYVEPDAGDSLVHRQVVEVLTRRSKAVVILTKQDSTTFMDRVATSRQSRVVTGTTPGGVAVLPGAVRGALDAAGIDVVRARAAATPIARPVAALTVRLEMKDSVLRFINPPNTVGILKGTDPKLRHEYVVFAAHMDHIGVSSGAAPDSINNGANDNASGTAGILELAEAFSRPGARPRRSLIFLTVSGEEKGMLGSEYFVKHPTVPLEQLAMNVTFDVIGLPFEGGTNTEIHVTGADFSDLGARLDRVVSRHPELKLQPVREERMSSDHASFAHAGVPILRFGGGSAGIHRVTDQPETIDPGFEASVVRLAFYVAYEAANADQRPQWDEASYKKMTKR